MATGDSTAKQPSTAGLALRAIAYPVIAFLVATVVSVGLQKLGVWEQVTYGVHPILELAVLVHLLRLASPLGRGYWMLIPGSLLFVVTLLIAVVGAPVGWRPHSEGRVAICLSLASRETHRRVALER